MTETQITHKKRHITTIVQILNEQRGFDFKGYRESMLERRIKKRMWETKHESPDEYILYLQQEPNELDLLLDVFTINVSRFFRNSLTFEYISSVLLPELYYNKLINKDTGCRIWSAACSCGEEPYSIAILLDKFLKKEELTFDINVFATDIDKKALERAEKGCYDHNSIKEVKYGILQEYFTHNKEQFYITQKVKDMVQFSFYDMMNKKSIAPPESIFGNFDIVLCRNLLIYFELDYQQQIFEKLYRSLKPNGYLILGDSEIPIEKFKHKFKREDKACKIYKKIG